MTNPIPTDWRALCAELFAIVEREHSGTSCLAELRIRTATALVQPEPQGPTDEELLELSAHHGVSYTMSSGEVVYPMQQSCDMRDDVLSFARAVLARWGRPAIEPDGPAVPDGREPASVTDQPTDKELLELMPETMRDEFSYAARTCSDAMGGRVKPGIFRVALNTAALEYARAVLARCGTANNTINQED
jgi:hypothetical protein